MTFSLKNNDNEQAHLDTDLILWNPPCYVEVVDFEKTDQTDSLDQLRTVLNYHIQLDHHGDEACNSQGAKIELQQGGIVNFVMNLDESDLEVALSDNGFDISIQAESSSAAGAIIEYSDDRAVDIANGTAAGYVAAVDYDCSIQIYDFCLDTATEVSSGRWAFDFNIRVEQNSQCGSLSASIDLIDEHGNYFGNVAVDGDQIIDAFNCQCEKVFSVTADYDGAPGEIYGQIDVRNGQQQVIQVMDSCTYEIA